MSYAVGRAELGATRPLARASRAQRLLRTMRRHQTALPALGVLGFMVLLAIFADLVSPADPRAGSLDARLAPPLTPGHLLGTDAVGRDVLARLIYGARVSLTVGFVAVGIGVFTGCLLGLLAGFFGGWVDTVLMRLADVQLSFPSFLLAISLMAVLGAGLINVILALSIGGWVRTARVMRSNVLPLREIEYVQAARAIGCGSRRLMLGHILPNAVTPVFVLATLSLGATIITESSLSFLGLGVDPETPSWGSMLAEGRPYLASAWWVATLPGIAISITVLGVNIVGDWLRDELDPRMKRRLV